MACFGSWSLLDRGAGAFSNRFRSERHTRASQPCFSFLELPSEIRNRIYAYLFVDEDLYSEDGKSVLREHIGGIFIHRVWPEGRLTDEYRSNYLSKGHEDRPPTYNAVTDVDFQLFYVCRQTYRESSYIFYIKNRFYADSITTMVLFLKDRPVWARGLIETVSIPVPHWSKRDELEEATGIQQSWIPRFPVVEEKIFAPACEAWSNHSDLLPHLKQLDLRIYEADADEDVVNLDTITATEKRAKQLASIADPRIMTLSLRSWHDLGVGTRTWQPVFQPLPDIIYQKIERHREEFMSREVDVRLDEEARTRFE